MKYRIKEIREDRDLTHKDIAKVLNMAQSTYSDLENEVSSAKAEYLILLANYYNTSVDYILGLTDVMKPYPRIMRKETNYEKN